MPDSIMYQEDGFIVLEPDRSEQFLSPEELKNKLKQIFQSEGFELPRELNKFDSLDSQVEYLMNNYFELDLGAGQYLQWYVIRLEK
ncbi:MAG: chlororespiratory reduction protein 7 [Stanieria sp.]